MAADFSPHSLRRLRDRMQVQVDRAHVPGAVLALGRGDAVVDCWAQGVRDPETRDPMRTDAMFRIYSMTKPIVSLACLMLAEQGRIFLADPVGKYLPELSGLQVARDPAQGLCTVPCERPPTVHDLLRHTAGFTYEFLGRDAVQCAYDAEDIASRGRSNAEFVRTLAKLPLAYQPGSCWMYSRATDVLGAVLEAVCGRALGQVLKEMIFDPLGMTETGFAVAEEVGHRLAEPFALDPDTGGAVRLIDVRRPAAFESGGGGLVSTASDYLRFIRLLRNRGVLEGSRLVSRKTVEWMTADHLGAIPSRSDLLAPGFGFGLGVAVQLATGGTPEPGSAGTYHWSGIGGTYFFIDPQEDIFAILLTQAPNQRIHYRRWFRHQVYAALD